MCGFPHYCVGGHNILLVFSGRTRLEGGNWVRFDFFRAVSFLFRACGSAIAFGLCVLRPRFCFAYLPRRSASLFCFVPRHRQARMRHSVGPAPPPFRDFSR